MAKSTQKQSLLTEKRIHQAIVDIFMEKGWEAISYGFIASHTGLSRGGVQRIVPSKEIMMTALQEPIIALIDGELDFSNDQSLKDSWIIALEKLPFRNCITFFIGAISGETSRKIFAKKGFEYFSKKVGQENMRTLISLSVYRLLDA